MAQAVAEYDRQETVAQEALDYLWTPSGVIRSTAAYEVLEKPREGRAVSASQRNTLEDPATRQTFLKELRNPRTGEIYPPDVTAWSAFIERGYISKGKENVWIKKAREASEEAKRRNRAGRADSESAEVNTPGRTNAHVRQSDLLEATKNEQYRTIAEKERTRSSVTRNFTSGEVDLQSSQEDQIWPPPERNEVHVHRIFSEDVYNEMRENDENEEKERNEGEVARVPIMRTAPKARARDIPYNTPLPLPGNRHTIICVDKYKLDGIQVPYEDWASDQYEAYLQRLSASGHVVLFPNVGATGASSHEAVRVEDPAVPDRAQSGGNSSAATPELSSIRAAGDSTSIAEKDGLRYESTYYLEGEPINRLQFHNALREDALNGDHYHCYRSGGRSRDGPSQIYS